jgi:AcrR family transcriptional regulator
MHNAWYACGMASNRKRMSNEERKDESRAALLRAGAGLLVKSTQQHPFAALRIRGICDEAGYSTGAFYVHWEKVEQYYEALSQYLLAQDGEMWDGPFADIANAARDVSLDDPLAALLHVADQDFGSLVDHEGWDAMELFLVTWGRTRYRDEAAEGYRAVDTKTADTYAVLLERLGRRPRPPFTLEQVATLLQGLVEGLGLRHRVEPDAVENVPTSEEPASLFPVGAACLLSVMTCSDDDERDTFDVLRELLSPPTRNHRPAKREAALRR